MVSIEIAVVSHFVVVVPRTDIVAVVLNVARAG